MAGYTWVTPGHDADYPFRQMRDGGKTARREPTAGKAGGPQYYLSAAEHQGEPAGHWVGEGLAWLGIHDGDQVKRDDFLALFGDHRVPGTEDEYLGKRPHEPAEVKKIFTELRAGRSYAELGREELHRLRAQARAEARCDGIPRMFFDVTFAVSKDVSLALASAMAAADQAREDGNQAAAELWQARVDGLEAALVSAARAGMEFMQRGARFTRTGSHNKRDGAELTGRWEDAEEIPVAAFLQHTNRDGEIHAHVHVPVLNKVQTLSDGTWRAINSPVLYQDKAGANAVFSLHLESELARRWGFEWKYNPDAKGRLLANVTPEMMAPFSSRREEVNAELAGLIEEYRQIHGKDPDQRAQWSMHQRAGLSTRRGKPEGALDFAQKLRDWDTQSRAAEMGALTDMAQIIWAPAGHSDAPGPGAEPGGGRILLTAQEARRVMAQAVATLTEERASFTRSDLIRALHAALPDRVLLAEPADAWPVLEALADRALAGEGGERVACLTPPGRQVPKALLRESDGRSFYQRPAAETYATVGTLSVERKAQAQAAAQGAPALDRARCAQLLGTTQEVLDAYLAQGCPVCDERTGRGLRMDQAVAAYLTLTGGRRFDVITGPAGTGKTFLAGVMADVWTEAGMGPVYGVALTSNARNQLRAASPAIRAYNVAQFLGHLEEAREARPGVAIGPGALVLVDEATMPSNLDMASILDRLDAAGAKGAGSGDHEQLGSPEAGGMFGAIARRQGEMQLNVAERVIRPDDAEPEWEADASLALRTGGPAALEALREYDDHGRLHGGTYEEAHERAARHFLREHMAGRNAIVVAQTHKETTELNRRIQGELVKWGKASAGQGVALAEGAQAHPGDWVMAGRNTKIRAGGANASRLINGDTLLIESKGQHDALARRLDGWGPDGPAWGPVFRVPLNYLGRSGRLGYALTWQTSQGRTVDVGITLSSDQRELRGLYESLTRGRKENHAYVYPASADPSEDAPPRGAPEAERHRQLEREAAGGAGQVGVDSRDALSILGAVAQRRVPHLLASEVGQRNYANHDHLAHLWGMWDDLHRRASGRRFTEAVQQLLPQDQADKVLAGSTDDLYRALRWAELTGRDGAEVLAEAVALGSLDDARSVAAVLAHRVREATEYLPTREQGSWESRAYATGDAELDQFVREQLGRGQDERQERLGKHHARAGEVWATQAIGPVPPEEQAAERGEWEQPAGILGAYRERFGWDHPGDAIGPRPPTTHPERRAEWDAAVQVLPRVDGLDLRGLSDGQLLARRTAYERECACQPPHVTEDLRLARKAEIGALTEAARFRYDAEAAERTGETEAAGRLRETHAQHEAVAGLAARIREKLEEAHGIRKQWNAITETTRRVGHAADVELHKRGILTDLDRLTTDPQAGDGEQQDEATQPERDKAGMERLGLTPGTDGKMPEAVEETHQAARKAREEIDDRLSQKVPDEDPDYEDIGPAWQDEMAKERDAVIQPPKPAMEPSEDIKERSWEFETARPADREPELG